MEKTKDSEKSHRIISFHWREEAKLRRQISSLESMKRQVEQSFCLDQRILCSRFQNKLRRSAQAWARVANSDEVLIGRLADENFGFSPTHGNDTERSTSQYGHCLQSLEPHPTGGTQARRSQSAYARSVLPRKSSRCILPKREGDILLEQARSQSSQPSFRRVAAPSSQRHCSSALTPLKRAVEPHPVTATVTTKDTEELPGHLKPTEESQDSAREADTDDSPIPASKTSSELTSKCLQDVTSKPEPLEDPTAKTPEGEEVEKSRGTEKSSTANTRGPELTVKVTRFVERVKSMKHQGSIMTDYYAHKLRENLSSRKEVLRVMDDDLDKWCLRGSERNSRSITIRGLDSAPPQDPTFYPPTDLLYLESYGALLTRENRDKRNWINNNPYSSTGPAASLR